jgi:hypothetical protein
VNWDPLHELSEASLSLKDSMNLAQFAGLRNDKRNVHASQAGTVSGLNYRANLGDNVDYAEIAGAPQLMTEERPPLSRLFLSL